MNNASSLENIARLVRYWILVSTTKAGSGHPSSSLSATDLMVSLLFGGFYRADLDDRDNPNNDRLIFSKGHAAPLMYALYAAAGKVSEKELLTLREFGSPLEGHPTVDFPFAEAATGSLGQGLSIGLGMALNAKYLDKLPYKTYVLLGDSEMSEGSNWEAIQLANFYDVDNLIGIVDVNRLGQRGPTMYGHDTEAYAKRIAAFGWKTLTINGHSFAEIGDAYAEAFRADRPVMILAHTVKGKGVPLIEDREGWHGKALSESQFEEAKSELGQVDTSWRGSVPAPDPIAPRRRTPVPYPDFAYTAGDKVATRQAYGEALMRLSESFPQLVVLDAEVSNSSFTELFMKKCPERFFEMFIAEQNMVGTAVGFARREKIPFVSTFAAFFSRAFDQIRMAAYSRVNIKFAGTHAGVSIGEDGPSQMGLEDLAMFRSVRDCVVLQPSDAVSTQKLVEEAASHMGMVYLRLARPAVPIIYGPEKDFPIGGSKILKSSPRDALTVAATGITVHEALAAYDLLIRDGIAVRVIDLYSVEPIDSLTLEKAARETGSIVVVEDHVPAGGLAEAVETALSAIPVPVYSLSVTKTPRSGKPEELLADQAIDRKAIVEKVMKLLGEQRIRKSASKGTR